MAFYARVTFQTSARAAERHDDEGAARRWIESERDANPDQFQLGQVLDRKTSGHEVVATCDQNGWH